MGEGDKRELFYLYTQFWYRTKIDLGKSIDIFKNPYNHSLKNIRENHKMYRGTE